MQVLEPTRIDPIIPFKQDSSTDLIAYRTLSDIQYAQRNPPHYFKYIHYPNKGIIQTFKKESNRCYFIDNTLEDILAMQVICFPGIAATEKLNQILVTTCAKEVFNQDIYGENSNDLSNKQELIGIYQPKFSPKERYHDLLEYYKNEFYIGRESIHIAENILLPIIYNSNHTIKLLRTFSLGAHEVKMAFTYAIEYLKTDNYDQHDIYNIINHFLVFNTGASISWHQTYCLLDLYPKTITLVSAEDKCIKHTWHAFQMICANQPSSGLKKIFTRSDVALKNEIFYIPAMGVIPISHQDNTHNIKNYSWLIQNTPVLKNLLQCVCQNKIGELESHWSDLSNISCPFNQAISSYEHHAHHVALVKQLYQEAKETVLYDDGDIIHFNLSHILHQFKPIFTLINKLNPYDFNNYEFISDHISKALTDVLPHCVLRALSHIKGHHSHRRKIILLHNCPSGSTPRLNNNEELVFEGENDFILQYLILGLTKLIGKQPMVDHNIQSGAVISNIYPKRSLRDKYNANSFGEFHYHNETAHKPHRPSSFIIGCNTQNPDLNVITSFILCNNLLQALPDNILECLSEELFEFDGGDVVLTKQSYTTAMLSLNSNNEVQDFRFNLNPNRMLPKSSLAKQSLDYISQLISQHKIKQHDIHFTQGMILIADNNASIHKRSSIEQEQILDDTHHDKPKRLLYRIHLQ